MNVDRVERTSLYLYIYTVLNLKGVGERKANDVCGDLDEMLVQWLRGSGC